MKGIIMTAHSVRTIRAGIKTQTRRVIKPRPHEDTKTIEWNADEKAFIPWSELRIGAPIVSPYGWVGTRLYVKEGFTHITGNGVRIHYRADGDPLGHDGRPIPHEAGTRRWMSPLFMSQKQSRITLEVWRVRAERLHAITDRDARAEGVEPYEHVSPDQQVPGPGFDRARLGDEPYRLPFADRWEEINGEGSWDANPWVWVVDFRVVRDEHGAPY